MKLAGAARGPELPRRTRSPVQGADVKGGCAGGWVGRGLSTRTQPSCNLNPEQPAVCGTQGPPASGFQSAAFVPFPG
jgi:hypothetical protein